MRPLLAVALFAATVVATGAATADEDATRGTEEAERDDSDEGPECDSRHDAHGKWRGTRSVGGNYTLRCDPGFEVDVSGKQAISLSCPGSGHWSEDATCVQHDDCADLKNSCGPMGLCIDRTGGYRCVCEDGYQLHRTADGTGEWVCGNLGQGVCSGATCGAYGVCVDLATVEANFDTGHVKQEAVKGEDTYRCSCAHGFRDDGRACVPLDCGQLRDPHGEWAGHSTVGGHYTLTCKEGAFIWGGKLASITMSCSAAGSWVSVPICIDTAEKEMDELMEAYHFWLNVSMAVVCVTCAALAAGLTIGMVSIEPFEMRMLLSTRGEDCLDDAERRKLAERQVHARKLLPVLEDHHLLLVTLLLLNSIANEALPIFLDELVPAAVAVALSVTAVLIFGEIVPSAVFTGPSQLRIAAMFTNVVRTFQLIFYCLAWPIARLLDKLLSDEDEHGAQGAEPWGGRYNRAELRSLLTLHGPRPPPPPASSKDDSTSEGNMPDGVGEPRDGSTRRASVKLARRQSNPNTSLAAVAPMASSVRSSLGPQEPKELVVPETCPPGEKPTLDGLELAIISSTLTLREKPLRKCLVAAPLQPEQLVSSAADVGSIWTGIQEGHVSAQWLLVCDPAAASVGDSSSSSNGRGSGGTFSPSRLRRRDVVGTLSSLSPPREADRTVKDVKGFFGSSIADPVWLSAEQSGLEAYRTLAQASAANRLRVSPRGEPLAATGADAFLAAPSLRAGPVVGLVVSSQGSSREIILGTVTLEDLAVALACGAWDSSAQAVQAPPSRRTTPRSPGGRLGAALSDRGLAAVMTTSPTSPKGYMPVPMHAESSTTLLG